MTLTELRYIVALARERHFGRAADKCNVSQPTLSVAVKKLEDELGVALFERSSGDVRTTPVGAGVVAQAERALAEAARVTEVAAAGKDPLAGPLRLGVIYTIGPWLLPALVPRVKKRAPNMPLFLKEDFTASLIPALKAGELDVIVIALPFADPGLVAQPVYSEPFRIVVPAGHPWVERGGIAADELEGQNLLLLGQGNCFRDQVLESCPRLSGPDALEHSLEGGSLETIRYMVASGAGVAVMPSTAADPLVDKEAMVRVLPFSREQPSRTVGLVWRVTFPRPQAIDAVRAALLSCQLPGATAVH